MYCSRKICCSFIDFVDVIFRGLRHSLTIEFMVLILDTSKCMLCNKFDDLIEPVKTTKIGIQRIIMNS
jgi:hypothetical protein